MSDAAGTPPPAGGQGAAGAWSGAVMAEARRPFLSIGEVLKVLREEFPDVTISKIRFLEAEGLIEPERTPSGYRKFSGEDVSRLRYILRAQRDHFMPLKVIRQRLEHLEPGSLGAVEAASAPAGFPPGAGEEDVADVSGLQLSFDELCSASGLEPEQLRQLEQFGLVDSHPLDGGLCYDEDDLMVSRIARDFGKYGIEPRHMKMYRHFAERESGLFEQVVIPRSRAGTRDGRRQAMQSLAELVKLSRRLKHLLLKAALREYLRG